MDDYKKNKEVLRFLRISRLARLAEAPLHAVGYPDAKYIENIRTDTQCFCVMRGKEMIVAFRGTEKKAKDWLTDFNALHMEYPYNNVDSDIKVHTGFSKAYKSVRSRIHKFYSDNIDNIDMVSVCGHSLGGALAVLCAIDIQYNFTNNIQCYTSGAPCVGNKAFAKSYNKRVPDTIRSYLKADIVPKLPPKWFGLHLCGGYKHVKQGYALGPWDIFIGLQHWFRRHFRTRRLSAELTNHSITLYEYYVEKNLYYYRLEAIGSEDD